MVVVFISPRKDCAGCMLEKISELERKAKTKIPLFEKILLAETGIVEQTLSILINSKIEVRILKQKETDLSIEREVSVNNKKTGEKLMHAKSMIFTNSLPYEIINQIKSKDRSIGSIITDFKLETFRKILEIGHNSKRGIFFRTYHITHNGEVAFEISENFIIKRKVIVTY
ncbi:MAG TPA: chorismate pyruvate-lyase family protein [Nitrososphaeraceae archaeon]|nr:chorismate pyruvate-lyase family protein [Nitrososphaeraceae archaeon]